MSGHWSVLTPDLKKLLTIFSHFMWTLGRSGCPDPYVSLSSYTTLIAAEIAKADVRRMIKSVDFCGHGLVARQNWLTKLVKRDTRPICSYCYFVRYQLAQQQNADRKIILATLFSCI